MTHSFFSQLPKKSRKLGLKNCLNCYGSRQLEIEVSHFGKMCLYYLFIHTFFAESRMAEMSSMGIGNKPCLDIRPSADQINDRSISFAQLSRSKYQICYFWKLGSFI